MGNHNLNTGQTLPVTALPSLPSRYKLPRKRFSPVTHLGSRAPPALGILNVVQLHRSNTLVGLATELISVNDLIGELWMLF